VRCAGLDRLLTSPQTSPTYGIVLFPAHNPFARRPGAVRSRERPDTDPTGEHLPGSRCVAWLGFRASLSQPAAPSHAAPIREQRTVSQLLRLLLRHLLLSDTPTAVRFA
jgi:hypothetical protein